MACILIYCIFTWFVELACLSKQRTCFIISSITIQWNLYSCRMRLFCWLSLFAGLGLLWSIQVQSLTLTLNTLTSVSIFSILFPTHFLNKNLFNNQKLLSPVAKTPIILTRGKILIRVFSFTFFKSLFQIITFILIWASNHQIVEKKNSTEFSFTAFRSESKFHTNPGLP